MRRITKLNWYVAKPIQYGAISDDPFEWEIRSAIAGSREDREMATGWVRNGMGELVRTVHVYEQFPNKHAANKHINDAREQAAVEWWERWEWERHRDGI